MRHQKTRIKKINYLFHFPKNAKKILKHFTLRFIVKSNLTNNFLFYIKIKFNIYKETVVCPKLLT